MTERNPLTQRTSMRSIGDFTLHGVTKPVQIALQAKRSGTTIAVTGSLPVKFADYGVSAPNSFVVLSVDDHGTMEFRGGWGTRQSEPAGPDPSVDAP